MSYQSDLVYLPSSFLFKENKSKPPKESKGAKENSENGGMPAGIASTLQNMMAQLNILTQVSVSLCIQFFQNNSDD